jgi:hypothetical protein
MAKNTEKGVQHLLSFEKYKSKPLWHVTSYTLGWSVSKKKKC